MIKIKALLKRLADWYRLERQRLQLKDDGLVNR